jgi:hypothetical protein
MTVATRWLRAGGRQVPLLAGTDALSRLPGALTEAGFEGRLFVVGDARAVELHVGLLQAVLPAAPVLRISGDEADKTLQQVASVWDWLVAQGAQRRDALVAFGGGVVCDLVGFAAASYLRGIGLVNVPTTLLAQVDAAVGGKTGINHPRGKNLIGAFYQPLCVVADTGLLGSLPRRAFSNGMAEVVKMAMILDADLFERLEHQVDELTSSSKPTSSSAMNANPAIGCCSTTGIRSATRSRPRPAMARCCTAKPSRSACTRLGSLRTSWACSTRATCGARTSCWLDSICRCAGQRSRLMMCCHVSFSTRNGQAAANAGSWPSELGRRGS